MQGAPRAWLLETLSYPPHCALLLYYSKESAAGGVRAAARDAAEGGACRCKPPGGARGLRPARRSAGLRAFHSKEGASHD